MAQYSMAGGTDAPYRLARLSSPDSLDIIDLPHVFSDYKSRYIDRDSRIMLMDQVVVGNYDQVDPEEDPLTSRSPNLIQVAIEDTAEAAALMPTIRIKPSKTGPKAKALAERQERVATGYFDACSMDFTVNQTLMDLVSFGFACWVVWPDLEQKLPLIEKRNPRYCYPQPGYRPGERVDNCLFARDLYLSQLPPDQIVKVSDVVDAAIFDANARIVLVEYFSKTEVLVGALYQHTSPVGSSTYVPVELDRIPIVTGVCPVVVGSRFTLDGEFRGQFDQVVGVLLAHVRLTAMVIDYADQAVYSDIWVKDLIGELPYGGGAYIELGPNGAVGRVPPAVTSLNIQQDIAQLVESMHLGGRWPKSRPGDISQAIASAKFLEATAGMMNTAIKTFHIILTKMMEQALRISFIMDRKYFPGVKTTQGILRNQEFLLEYDPMADIDLHNKIGIEYGLGLGRDPSQSAVLMLQYEQGKFISKEFVQENIEGLVDVAREQARIDVSQFTDIAMATILQGLQSKEIGGEALVKMAQGRLDGQDIFTLYKKYVLDPAAAQVAGQIPSGIGPPVTPGLPGMAAAPGGPGPGGMGPPPGAGPAVPPGPPMPAMLARLGVPAGPGGLLGSQTISGTPTGRP